jgi:prepilin-type N-terminal cleavage/methylation domain-containing protein
MPPDMKTTHGRLRRDAGFSLIEIVVVLAMMGIVAALAQPSLDAYVNRSKTRRALDRMSGDIAMARILAVRSGDRAVLEVSGPDSYRVWVESVPVDTIRVVSLADDYAGVQLQAPTADGRLVFNGRGLLVTPGTGLMIARLGGGVADTLKITAAGRVYRAY